MADRQQQLDFDREVRLARLRDLELERLGFSAREIQIIGLIMESPAAAGDKETDRVGLVLSRQQIADALGIAKSTAAKYVDWLRRRGVLETANRPGNRQLLILSWPRIAKVKPGASPVAIDSPDLFPPESDRPSFGGEHPASGGEHPSFGGEHPASAPRSAGVHGASAPRSASVHGAFAPVRPQRNVEKSISKDRAERERNVATNVNVNVNVTRAPPDPSAAYSDRLAMPWRSADGLTGEDLKAIVVAPDLHALDRLWAHAVQQSWIPDTQHDWLWFHSAVHYCAYKADHPMGLLNRAMQGRAMKARSIKDAFVLQVQIEDEDWARRLYRERFADPVLARTEET